MKKIECEEKDMTEYQMGVAEFKDMVERKFVLSNDQRAVLMQAAFNNHEVTVRIWTTPFGNYLTSLQEVKP